MVISDKGVQENTTEEGVPPAAGEEKQGTKQARTGVFGGSGV